MPVQSNIEANVGNILSALDRAADVQAEILLTPEGSVSGYTHLFDKSAVENAVTRITSHARLKRVGLALGTCFIEADNKCYNQIRFHRADGSYLGFHSKTLCCGTLDEPSIGEINHYCTAPLRTFEWQPGLTIGGLICNDLWADPEYTPMPDVHLSQQLARMGAQIIFHAVNGGHDDSEWSQVIWKYHESNLQMRSRAGKVWIVTVDSPASE